ncbi:RNA-directed DNA polymerase (reverse transcriptase)-related family protein [Rhynchospora pubera]|uniref:RNA-directed DNA polymerase (Reverse transcriptase)-related family protein n=1 Tax=Rhynchospora pubera TaxID=906938 RepID=A0AAV8DHW3_9POAL|nr:RNA-directed DNA polymerase (reverse transcriptase)-related family protein [Rhynchospora pubera]
MPLPYNGILPCLFYADDSLFFFKPTLQQAQLLKLLLDCFQNISGLALNPSKSDLLVLNTEPLMTESLKTTLGCKLSSFPISYLGLPLSDKALCKKDYENLILRFQQKLSGWSASLLSIAGRTVLLNACLSSLPIYFMSAFKLPSWVIRKVDALRRNFLWHGNRQGKLILVSWDRVCLPKIVGGLGVLDLSVMNKALLARWLWAWISKKESIWTSLHSILQNGKLSTYPLQGHLSTTFRDMEDLFSSVIHFHLGNGKMVLFWHFDWGHGILKHRFADLFSYTDGKGISVHYFFQNRNNLHALFKPTIHASSSAMSQLSAVQQLLQESSAAQNSQPDVAIWKPELAKNSFSTKSLYTFLKTFPKHKSKWTGIWKLKIPPRMIFFLWRLLQNRLATMETLTRRGWNLPSICCLCRNGEDSVQHLFNECPFSGQAKFKTFSVLCPDNMHCVVMEIAKVMQDDFRLSSNKPKEILAITCFVLWRERCARIFNQQSKEMWLLVDQVTFEWTSTNCSHWLVLFLLSLHT